MEAIQKVRRTVDGRLGHSGVPMIGLKVMEEWKQSLFDKTMEAYSRARRREDDWRPIPFTLSLDLVGFGLVGNQKEDEDG